MAREPNEMVTITIPCWLWLAMSASYWGQKQPEVVQEQVSQRVREYNPPAEETGFPLEVVTQRAPSGYEPKGAALRKRSKAFDSFRE